ncbi:MAG: NAD(P)-binding domain-containing protein [Chloroflexi bacterium]|nr:NAD(P)-binding domain-containing protein [Chloroflexota bacterium]
MSSSKHFSVIVIGAGPGGLGVGALMQGWRPHLVGDVPPRFAAYGIGEHLREHGEDLLRVDMQSMVEAGIKPFDLFRILHHPTNEYRGKRDRVIDFHPVQPVDWLMISESPPGGLWNDVPRNQVTLSPGHWMEMAPFRLDDFIEETGRDLDPNALIEKEDLVPYFHWFAEKTGISERGMFGHSVSSVRRTDDGRFSVEVSKNGIEPTSEYSCDFLVFAAGPRVRMRSLGVPGDDLPYVSHHYDHWDDHPEERVLVVGGGRSADWAVTELFDAGRAVTYVMRGDEATHLRLINDSQHLPYYQRINEIIKTKTDRFIRHYGDEVVRFNDDKTIELFDGGSVQVDHVIVEIGGAPAYDLLSSLGPLTMVEGRDNYRLQLMQMAVDPATFESVDVPNLYPAGYLPAGMGISVLGMHGNVYPMAADILRKLGRLD